MEEEGADVTYLETTRALYAAAAQVPDDQLCCIGDAPHFDDGAGHVLRQDVPLPVCDKTAEALTRLGRDDLMVTESTWHYDGGGCC